MEEWHPGSFTKNFSWGAASNGLRELHSLIKQGFGSDQRDVPRAVFRQRISSSGRPDYIPLNFFLYNRIKNGIDFVVLDELVFQAINFRHSSSFDKLALFAFNLSVVGKWKGAADYQSRPALWAKNYLSNRVARDFQWNAKRVDADDIELYVKSDSRYRAATARKLATNLAYLYKQGRLSDFRSDKPERWWLSALFLTLDRACADLISEGRVPQESQFAEYPIRYGFPQIAGPRSLDKDLAALRFTKLYDACGGLSRFSDEASMERQRILVPDVQNFANNPEPVGVFHPSNPKARGAIPRACAMLAQYVAGFEWIDIDRLDDFDVESFVRDRTHRAIDELKNHDIKPTMSVEDLLNLTRSE